MYDYRKLEDEASALQAKVLAIHELKDADGNIPAEKRDELMRLMGRIEALEEKASEMKDAEIAELREVVARGQLVGGAAPSTADKEMADFRHYLRTGEILDTATGLSTTDANGGYIVPEPAHADLIEKIRLNNPVFGNATLFRLTGDTTITLPFKATQGVVANATETGARAEQNAPTFTSPTLTCYDYFTDQRATQQWVDSVGNAEEMLLSWIAADIQEQAEADAVIGDGTTKIKGLFAESANLTKVLSGSAGKIANTAFLAVYFSLPVKHRRSANWLMAPATLAAAAALAYPNLDNTPLCSQNANGDWVILGKTVLESDSAPAIGAANYPVCFADIASAYAVAIHRSTSILRDPYTATPKIRYYGLARMGGCAWDYQAAILMKSNDA